MSNAETSSWERLNDLDCTEYYAQTLSTITGWEFVRDYKNKSYQMLGLEKGMRVLDVGCGLGDDVFAMSQMLGPEGACYGLDLSKDMIQKAKEKANEESIHNAHFMEGNGEKLPFEDAIFDGCRADRVLQHVNNRGTVIAEMVRVLKPGGRLVSIDPDWETMVFDFPDKELTREVCRAICDRVKNGWAGHQSPGLYADAGLQDVASVPVTSILSDMNLARTVLEMDRALDECLEVGSLSTKHVENWNRMMATMHDKGRFFGAMTGFITLGRKSA